VSISYQERYVSWLHAIRARELEAIVQCLPSGRFEAILELGCGDGFQSMKLKQMCKVLVSTDYRLTAVNRTHSKILTFVVCDAERLPFKAGSFDAVFSSNMLEHLEDIDRALKEMKCVLQPHGMMIHTVPNVTWKLLQLVLHYPFIVFLELSKLRQCFKGHSKDFPTEIQKREDSDVKRKRDPKTRLKRFVGRMFPSIHGVAKSHVEELYRFSDRYWRGVFKRNALQLKRIRQRMPLYSAYGFGFSRLRNLGELLGLSSCCCYVVEMASPDGSPRENE
jgi:ubiquinone/menaquinone biosynthesis C-methylase UbiE